MAGIYIHIPFCKQRCRYCAFYSTTLHGLRDEYVDAVCKELFLRSDYVKGEKAETLYLGGGTPSLLDGKQIENILDAAKKAYDIVPDAELTIECNPDDLTPGYATMLHAAGFNRISMGVQSFNDKLLEMLGRRHTADGARSAVENARAAGFKNISIDLMFALPGSSEKSWAVDLQSAIALQPTHISAYNLTYEEGTPLQRALKQGKIAELSEEENIKQFATLRKELQKAGYRHYEISNFALPGYESRHNGNYWNDTPYTGCGAGAHSYNGLSRGWNISDVASYIKGVNEGCGFFEVESLTPYERYNDTVLTRLRTVEGIPVDWVKERFGDDMASYMAKAASRHFACGNLTEKNGCFRLTEKGIFVSDSVMRDLIFVE